MAWELDSKRSIYGQLVDVIIRRIVTGIYPAGSKLDSVRDLASEAGVNPNTMQRALSELERTGIINTQRTSGKYVTEDQEMIENIRREMANGLVEGLFKDLRELGYEESDVIDIVRRKSDERDNGVS